VSEPVLLQLIATAGVVIAALLLFFGTVLTLLSNRTRQHARAASDNSAQARDQVTNDHTLNLRDDLDEKFRQVNLRFDLQARQIGRLFANDRELHEELEQTRPRKPRSNKTKEKQ
jgi:hypothetical protein